MRVDIKPLSVNRAWQGHRFKTPEYKDYEKELLLKLKPLKGLKAPYRINVTFGISVTSDIDNPTKPFLDILQKKYGINDRDIMELNLKKVVVSKGNAFIDFEILPY